LIGSIGLIGADRVDLFAGRGPFTLTPFLVLAPLVLLIGILRTSPGGMFRLSITPPIRRQEPFVIASGLFLALSFASASIGLDPERSMVAFVDLFLVAVLGYFISLQILKEPDQEKLIVTSIAFGLIVYSVFCVAEFIAWSHGVVITAQREGSWLEWTFGPGTLGPWAPTLSGTNYDSNRSGFVLTMYLALVDRFAPKSCYAPFFRIAIPLLIGLSLSRSGTLCWLAYYLSSRSFWRRLASRRVLVRIAAVAIVGSLVFAVYQEQIIELAQAWEIADAVSAKMSMDPGSSGESHILLIERGLKTWLTSTKTVMTGIGYAAAPKVLEDFFGNDKRGNFHNLYVTTLAEMGLPAFLVLLFLLIYPIFGRNGVVPCIAAILVFNVSYQTETEPMLWLMLALLWSYDRRKSRRPQSVALAHRFAD
jgi:O-antigen ligase